MLKAKISIKYSDLTNEGTILHQSFSTKQLALEAAFDKCEEMIGKPGKEIHSFGLTVYPEK